MGNPREFRYRPNEVLDYITMEGEVTFKDLSKRFNFTELDTASVTFDLCDRYFISHSINPPPNGGVSFATYKLTPLGREKMKEDIGEVVSLVEDYYLSSQALGFLSRYANRRLANEKETDTAIISIIKEAFTQEELDELKKEFPNL